METEAGGEVREVADDSTPVKPPEGHWSRVVFLLYYVPKGKSEAFAFLDVKEILTRYLLIN